MRSVLLFLSFWSFVRAAGDNAELIFNTAVRSLSDGDYRKAEKGFLAVLQAKPKHLGALGNLGVVYSRTGQIDQAIATYRRALAIAPNETRLLLNLGLAYLREDAEAAALPIFRRLAELDRGNLQVRELLATCLLYTGQPGEAVLSLEELRKLDSGNTGLLYLLGVGYLKLKDRTSAEAAFREFLQSSPPGRSSLVMCKAYYQSELMQEAEQQCRAALEYNRGEEGAWRELGKVLVSLRHPGAEEALRAALRQNATDAEALYFLGGLLVLENRLEEATGLLEKGKQLNPGFWGNYFYLGRAKLQAKQPEAAVSFFRKAAELNSSESAVFYQLGRALQAAHRPEEAKRAMNRVRELKERGQKEDADALPR